MSNRILIIPSTGYFSYEKVKFKYRVGLNVFTDETDKYLPKNNPLVLIEYEDLHKYVNRISLKLTYYCKAKLLDDSIVNKEDNFGITLTITNKVILSEKKLIPKQDRKDFVNPVRIGFPPPIAYEKELFTEPKINYKELSQMSDVRCLIDEEFKE